MSFSRLPGPCSALALLSLLSAGCLEAGLAGADGGTGPGTDAGTGTGPGLSTGGDSGSVMQGTGLGSGGDTGVSTVDAGAGADGTASSGDAAQGDGGTTSGGAYKVDLSQTSVSGFSSGAFFAVQFHVAYSSIIKGAAIFAGGPYDCAQDSESNATGLCLTGSPDAAALVTITKQNYSSGLIDNWANLASEKVFIFGGGDDNVVDPTVVDSLNTYYGSFITTSSSIQYVSRHAGTDHTMPTTWTGGSACDNPTAQYHTTSPYVGNCNYDGAGMGLKQIFGTLNPAATTLSGQIHSFSQATFLANPTISGLAETGYYYVPASCASGASCKVHISFHGCEQTAGTGLYAVGDAYYTHAGYNEWADTNNMIVLYPQATNSSGNDYGCWDFWGYADSNYQDQKGIQVGAVRKMLAWLAGGGTTDGGTVTPTDAGHTGSDSGTSGSGDACYVAANHSCAKYMGAGAECSALGGTAAAACPSASLAGCCTIGGSETCYYTGGTGLQMYTASNVQATCFGGTFSATP